MRKIITILLLLSGMLVVPAFSIYAESLSEAREDPALFSNTDTVIDDLSLPMGDYSPVGTELEYEKPSTDTGSLFRNAPSVYIKVGVAQRCDWLYVDAYKEQTKLLGTGMKVCSSDGEQGPLMQNRQRYVYCIEWSKTTPNGYVGITTDALRNKAVVTCLMQGARYWGGTCSNAAFSTGDSAMDYYITQMALHICNGEFSFDQWNAQAVFGLPYSGAKWIYDLVAPRIRLMSDYCSNPANQPDFDGNNVYHGFYIDTRQPQGDGWHEETKDGVLGFSTNPFDITLRDKVGLQNINEWLNQITITTDCPEASILRGDNPSAIWNSWRIWLPADTYKAFTRFGKTIQINVAGNIPGGFAGYSYYPGASDYQKITLLEMTTGSPHDVNQPVTVTIPKTGPDLCDLTVSKRIPVYTTITRENMPLQIPDITWAHGNPTFLIDVKGKDLQGIFHQYTASFEFTKEYVDSNTDSDGFVTLSHTFQNIPAGTAYEITEQRASRYTLDHIASADSNISLQDTCAVADLVEKPSKSNVTFTNIKYRWDQYSHNDIRINSFSVQGLL